MDQGDYIAFPSAASLDVLKRQVATEGGNLIFAVHQAFQKNKSWRSAQHLALLLEKEGYASYAMYFAEKAVELSNGDPLARLLLTKVLWLRRLPEAVLYQTARLRFSSKRIRDKRMRAAVMYEIAELEICAYAYLPSMEHVRPAIAIATRQGRLLSRDAALQLLVGAKAARVDDLQQLAALTLAPQFEQFGGRIQHMVTEGVRKSLLNLLRARG